MNEKASSLKVSCLASRHFNHFRPPEASSLFPVSVLVEVLRTTPESLRVLDSAFEGPSRAGDGAAWGRPSRFF